MRQITSHQRRRTLQIPLGLLLLLTGWLALATKAIAGATPSHEAERYLDNFMSELSSSQEGNGHSLSERVDRLAKALDKASARDPKLVSGLGQALQLGELSQPSEGSARRRRSIGSILDAPSEPPRVLHATRLADPEKIRELAKNVIARPASSLGQMRRKRSFSLGSLLDDEPSNPHLIHASRRADPEKICKLAETDFKRLSGYDQRVWLDAANNFEAGATTSTAIVISDPSQGKVRKTFRFLGSLIGTITNYGLMFMDHFHAAPKFIDELPVIGEKVAKLRRDGEPIYHIINMVRYTASLYKLELARGSTPVVSGDDTSLQVVQLDEAARNEKISQLKSAIGSKGLAALKSIALRVMTSKAMAMSGEPSGEALKEADTRALYLLLSYASDILK